MGKPKMDLALDIILIIGPLFAGVYLETLNFPLELKIPAWILFVLVIVRSMRKLAKEVKEAKTKDYSLYLQERQELFSRGRPETYINGLGDNPLLKDHFNLGQKYREESKFEEAIKKYEQCLSHSKATEENKVAANTLIGICYYDLSRLKEAENYYKTALRITKKVRDKREKLKGKSMALNNIGIIYGDLGKPSKALKYFSDALKIHKEIDYEQGIASNIGNIGRIYMGLGNLDEALKHHNKALEINTKIGS